MNIEIKNNCVSKIDILSNENSKFINKCKLNHKESCKINYDNPVFESGLIKTINSDQATLFEFTKNKQGIWYDISVIPPDNNIHSDNYCITNNIKSGFNVPLQVTVKQDKILNSRCNDLSCLDSKCKDAYLYFNDDTKTHFCNSYTNFTLTYC